MARYVIDPEQSRVRFEVQSSVHAITASTTGVSGYIEAVVLPGGELDLSSPPTGEVTVPIAKLSSGNLLYDREIRRRARLRQHPTVTGSLTDVSAGGDAGRYVAAGSVQFQGRTVAANDEITLDVTPDGSITVEGAHTFDVRDFGIEPPSLLLLRVSPDVRVTISLVATPEVTPRATRSAT